MANKSHKNKKAKGIRSNEINPQGTMRASDYIQLMGDPRGLAFDQHIAAVASLHPEGFFDRD